MGVMFPELAYRNNTFDNLKFVNKWLSKHFTIEAQFIKRSTMGSNKKRVSEDTEDYKVKRARNNEVFVYLAIVSAHPESVPIKFPFPILGC